MTPLALDIPAIRRQFPILSQSIDGHPLIYLDNAATTQKPRAVLDAMTHFYETANANPHRGLYALADRATQAYEDARGRVAAFINAARREEIVFTKSATESINLVAKSWGRTLEPGDVIALPVTEHHSNIVPWLQLKEEKGIELTWIDVDEKGRVNLSQLEKMLEEKSMKLLALSALSNVLGTAPPLEKIISIAHRMGCLVLIDAAQAVAHHPIDVRALDADFLAFSSHKLYGPTGIGVLWGREHLLDAMPPVLGGGMMIDEVHRDRFTFADIPMRFEGGTPPVAEAVGLKASIDWLTQFPWKDIEAHERALLERAQRELSEIPGLSIVGGKTAERSGSLSFTLAGIHPHDLAELLGRRGICVRAGHHCTQPLHKYFAVPASTRLSVAIYNTEEEVLTLSSSIRDIQPSLR